MLDNTTVAGRSHSRVRVSFLSVCVAAVLAAAVGCAPTQSRSTGPADIDALRATLQHDADHLVDLGAPGVLVEVSNPSGTLKVRAGVANTTTGQPVAWNTHFRVGSLTKPFVSTTLLQLVGAHRLSLDDTVERWLPGVIRGHGNDGRRITIRNLLQHTSGLPEYMHALPWLLSEQGFQQHRYDTITDHDAIAMALESQSLFAPSTSWSYSNTNYRVAALVIEAVTAKPWAVAVRTGILDPLRLTQTSIPGTTSELPQPHAVGYQRFPGKGWTPDDPRYGQPVDATRQNPSYGGAAGEIVSTTHDTTAFLRALAGGKLLAPTEQAAMMSTVDTDDAFRQNWPGSRYGLGLESTPVSCGPAWSHGGDILGYATRNAVSADGTTAVTITMNTDSPVPQPNLETPASEMTRDLIDHALCLARVP